jgi:hypothetical protein
MEKYFTIKNTGITKCQDNSSKNITHPKENCLVSPFF